MQEVDFNFDNFNLSDHEILASEMNHVARIKGLGVIKITPEDGSVLRFPNTKAFKDRILRDLVFNHYCKICPEILSFDLSKRYFLMEDLGKNDLRSLLRKADEETAIKLLKIVETLFKNLDKFYSKQKDLPEVFREENPLLEDHYADIFYLPLFDHDRVKSIWHDMALPKIDLDSLESDYCKIKDVGIKEFTDYKSLEGETLIHGDLHTASIVNRKTKSYLIDGEFAHLGNKDFDLGMLYANLLIDLLISGNDQILLETIEQNLKPLAKQVALFELVRQCIGRSFSVPVQAAQARKKIFEYIEFLVTDDLKN